jgi:hypothetical protein
MVIDKEIKAQMAEVLGQAHISDKTAQDITLICKGGLEPEEVIALRGLTNPGNGTVNNLRNKSKKWLLANPDMQKLAHNAAKKILKGQPIISEYTENDEIKQHVMLPKMSNVVAVMDMVTKRTEPIEQQSTVRESNTYVQVNIDGYKAQDMVMPHDDNKPVDHKCNDINDLEHID